FPEGTTNRDPVNLLPGRVGTARLSLETGVSVIPVGVRYPGVPAGQRRPESAEMEIFIGAAMQPPPMAGDKPTLSETQAWHTHIMQELADLCGKTFTPRLRSNDANENGALDI
ncbi:MAG: lysophospholipid acyltransferase family protein, partial [Alphaproteobacteria bacterium]